MCFSAPASFAVSAGLLAAGIVAFRKARNRPERVFAFIPFGFAVQQSLEGLVWLSICNGAAAPWHHFALYGYLIFAWLVWPVHIPVSVLLLERMPGRRRLLRLFAGCGIMVALGLAVVLASSNVVAQDAGHHVAYVYGSTYIGSKLIALFYVLATVGAPLYSGHVRVKWIGVVNLIAVLISQVWFRDAFISVWCYFAAVLSVLVVWVIYGFRKSMDHGR